MLKRKDIRVRDPYIVLHEDTYYLYATSGDTTLSFYESADLENWQEGGVCFEIPENFWAVKDVWAAEVHFYREKFYLFVSLLGRDGLRGTQVAVADTPKGPFVPIANGPVTPKTQSCIDATLFVQDGVPYVFYSHDWPDCYDAQKDAYVGEICAVQVTEDLTAMVGEPWRIYRSDESPVSAAAPAHLEWEGKPVVRYGSDAPFVQKLSDGKLLLTWSPYLDGNYVVLGVVNESGNVRGEWKHLQEPIFDQNGGHAMFFTDTSGKKCMCLHAPERYDLERATLFLMKEENGTLGIVRKI